MHLNCIYASRTKVAEYKFYVNFFARLFPNGGKEQLSKPSSTKKIYFC